MQEKWQDTIGDFGAYSFNGNKIITTGGGGAVTASSKEALDHMKYISTQAKNDTLYYVHDEVGYNYRMTNIQAALASRTNGRIARVYKTQKKQLSAL